MKRLLHQHGRQIVRKLLRAIFRKPAYRHEQLRRVVGPEFVSGNIYVRPIHMGLGSEVGGHTHNFDHTTIVFTGTVEAVVTKPDGSIFTQVITAPDFLLIKADYKHSFRALEDGTVMWCVYSHRDPQGRVTLEKTGWDAGYV